MNMAECRKSTALPADRSAPSSDNLGVFQVDENEEANLGYQTPTSPLKSELALQKGFRRRTWTGPAWLDNVTSTGHVSTPLSIVLHDNPTTCILMQGVSLFLHSAEHMT